MLYIRVLQADRDSQARSLLAAQHAQDVAGHAAAQAKQKADDLQRQLASAQQEQLRLVCTAHEYLLDCPPRVLLWHVWHSTDLNMLSCCYHEGDVCRLKTSFKAQSVLLEKSRAMQDEMADVLLSLEVILPSRMSS